MSPKPHSTKHQLPDTIGFRRSTNCPSPHGRWRAHVEAIQADWTGISPGFQSTTLSGRPPRESRPNFTMRDSRWVALGLIHYTACGQSGRCPRGAHGSFSIVGRVVGYTSVVHIDKTDGECIATTEVEAGSVPEICLRDGVTQRANATGAARSR